MPFSQLNSIVTYKIIKETSWNNSFNVNIRINQLLKKSIYIHTTELFQNDINAFYQPTYVCILSD